MAAAGVSIIRAAFAHSFFVCPRAVGEQPVRFPDFARKSREHYPGKDQGDDAVWKGRKVKLELNGRAQMAWERYTGHSLIRGSGYSVRHIWGNPWNPDAFTAGWNLCYMPFWAGMLTEKQHPHEELLLAFQQASWNLYFGVNPVCPPPDFVKDSGMNLESMLGEQPVLILNRSHLRQSEGRNKPSPELSENANSEDVWERIKDIRTNTHCSWKNIHKAVLALQNKPHEPFGTRNVENGTKSAVRRIQKETGVSLARLESLLDENGVGR